MNVFGFVFFSSLFCRSRMPAHPSSKESDSLYANNIQIEMNRKNMSYKALAIPSTKQKKSKPIFSIFEIFDFIRHADTQLPQILYKTKQTKNEKPNNKKTKPNVKNNQKSPPLIHHPLIILQNIRRFHHPGDLQFSLHLRFLLHFSLHLTFLQIQIRIIRCRKLF